MTFNPSFWYLHGSAYDFSAFVEQHPGGTHAINAGKGRDCTELFETYHLNITKPSSYLRRFRVKTEIVRDRADFYPLTFEKNAFYRTVSQRVQMYFKSNGIPHTKGGLFEIIEFILLLIAYVVTGYFAFFENSALAAILFSNCKTIIVCTAGHSSSHYSFSKYPTVNYVAFYISSFIIGTDAPAQWTTKHIIKHHILTNITPNDNDSGYPIKRCFEQYPRLWFHRYQHLYSWILYSFVMAVMSTTKSLSLWYGMLLDNGTVWEGLIKVNYNAVESISNNVLHHFVRWILPFYCCTGIFNKIYIFLLIELSHFWLGFVFMLGHEVKEAAVHSKELDEMQKTKRSLDFGEHQVLVSHNYSVDSILALHLTGGLNTHIEHHLFPSVHYKYYKDLAKIVKTTCKDFNVPYNESKSFWCAVKKHYALLKRLGNHDTF